MKRFLAVITLLIVGTLFTSLVEMPEKKDAMKVEVSDATSVAIDALAVQSYDLQYVAEATTEVIRDFVPKDIGVTSDAYAASILHPPKTDFLAHRVIPLVRRC